MDMTTDQPDCQSSQNPSAALRLGALTFVAAHIAFIVYGLELLRDGVCWYQGPAPALVFGVLCMGVFVVAWLSSTLVLIALNRIVRRVRWHPVGAVLLLALAVMHAIEMAVFVHDVRVVTDNSGTTAAFEMCWATAAQRPGRAR